MKLFFVLGSMNKHMMNPADELNPLLTIFIGLMLLWLVLFCTYFIRSKFNKKLRFILYQAPIGFVLYTVFSTAYLQNNYVNQSLNSGMPDSYGYLIIQSYVWRMTITLGLGSMVVFLGTIFIGLTTSEQQEG